MVIGSRVLYPEEVGRWDAEILQISVYRGMKNNLKLMKKCAKRCRDAGIPYVIHPVSYFLLDNKRIKEIWEMAEWSDVAMILHDEKSHIGERLEGWNEMRYKRVLEEIKSITNVSFENATDTGDVLWFWDNYADSVTLDLGHVESSGLDSVEFVKALDNKIINKIQFVHMHRNNGLRGGLTDHWPLSPDCREMRALRELLQIKPDVSAILEINEVEQIGQSLEMLRALRSELKAEE
jgi:sugar phosphate isomerase/epimerase